MTASPKSHERDQADQEALDWLILLQDDPDDAVELARFEVWRSARPDHARAWADAQLTVNLIDMVAPVHLQAWASLNSAAVPGAGRRRLQGHRSRRGAGVSASPGRRRERRIVALALAAACVALFAAPTLSLRLRSDYVSGVGKARVVRLQDGSEMHLAPDSAVKLAFSEDRRGVRLLKGEAYFEVQRDPSRRFFVDAGDVRTSVLGTGFDVRHAREGAQVAVRHGLVRVDSMHGQAPVSVRLSAGDRIEVSSKGGVMSREKPERVGAWTKGDLIVTDQSVQSVVEALKPWHRGVILVAGDGLQGRRVTGVYDLRRPEAALKSLAQVHDLKLRRITPWITVISAA